jgi:signal transduction histidine kinase
MLRWLVWAKEHVFEGVALVGVVLTQVDVWNGVDENRSRLAAVALCTAGALLFRRRAPFAAPLVVATGAFVLTFLDAAAAYDLDAMFIVLLLACWAAGSLPDVRQAAIAFLAVLTSGWTVFLRAPDLPWTELIWLSFPLTGVFAISAAAARHAERAQAAEERARRSEEQAERAVEDERSRIARELHDVIAHSVSVMTVQAGAVRRLLAPEQEREREALLTVEETGRQALTEMRRLLGVLRRPDETAALAPQPGLATLEQLVAQVREAGLPVEIRFEGEPIGLPPGIDLSAYRIVQEALTNALKHAGPARAWVVVRYGADQVEVEVANDGVSNGSGDGYGLIGMRERVALCGGDLTAGPRTGGGFTISARLPVAGSTA